jgi:hypothetical protein
MHIDWVGVHMCTMRTSDQLNRVRFHRHGIASVFGDDVTGVVTRMAVFPLMVSIWLIFL